MTEYRITEADRRRWREFPAIVAANRGGKRDYKPAPPGRHDKATGEASRACARCGKAFKPTLVRKMLCGRCFHDEDRNSLL